MFEFLKKYSQIFVTGPQRSGTTICAKMIANDIGHRYVDEFKIRISNRRLLDELLNKSIGNVIQCPGCCRFIHEYSTDDVAIILVRRDIDEILASQARINWNSETMELMQYSKDERFGLKAISTIKYRFWDAGQRLKIHHPFEIQYDLLSAHPLWIDPEFRKKFHAKQTKLQDNPHEKLVD